MKNLTLCVYGNHHYDVQKVGTGYIYTDLQNGVKEDTPICPACYLAHLRRYYPDCQYVKNHKGE